MSDKRGTMSAGHDSDRLAADSRRLAAPDECSTRITPESLAVSRDERWLA